MNDYDHGHAWDARYNKSESKSETIGTVFSEKEIHNATIEAVIAKINLLLTDVSRLTYEWGQSNIETSTRYKHRVEGVKRALALIKSMKRG